MKNRLLTGLMALFSILSFQASAQEMNDPKAKEVLDKVSSKTQQYKTITATFTSSLENKQAGMKVDQEGVLKLKGTRFNLTLDDYNIISDGTTTWTIATADNEVYIDNTSEMAGGDINPTEIFTMWEKGFKYKYVGEESVNGSACHHINLFPKNPKEKNYHTIKLYIGKSDLEIKKVVALGKSGDIYTYSIKSFNVNHDLADNLFLFSKSKYPGINVVDNRF
ncbi:MAG: LolA family protein [Luteibaculum sp.]